MLETNEIFLELRPFSDLIRTSKVITTLIYSQCLRIRPRLCAFFPSLFLVSMSQQPDALSHIVFRLIESEIIGCICSNVVRFVPFIQYNLLHSLRHVETVVDICHLILQARQRHLIVGILAVGDDITKYRCDTQPAPILEPEHRSSLVQLYEILLTCTNTHETSSTRGLVPLRAIICFRLFHEDPCGIVTANAGVNKLAAVVIAERHRREESRCSGSCTSSLPDGALNWG